MLTYERDVLVGRQGIHTEDRLVGYELLFRSNLQSNPQAQATGDQMTAEVLFGAVSIGLFSLAQDRLIFCNADRGVLTGDVPIPLPPQQTVIEVLETVSVDDEVIAACRALKEDGFTIALDDFVYGTGHERLLPYADIVKIDLLATPPVERRAVVERCRAYPVTLLAEKVENREDIPQLLLEGFTLFQGFALDKPVIVRGRTATPTALSSIQSAVQVLSGDADFAELESIIRKDPALTLQILKLASTGRAGENRHEISTVRDALVRCGTRQIRTWLGLLLARRAGYGEDSQDAIITVLLRARACELLAHEHGVDPQFAFTAGLLSASDHLLRVPKEDIAASLDLSTELLEAAFGSNGNTANLINDLANWPQAGPVSPSSGLTFDHIASAHADAFAWAMDIAEVM